MGRASQEVVVPCLSGRAPRHAEREARQGRERERTRRRRAYIRRRGSPKTRPRNARSSLTETSSENAEVTNALGAACMSVDQGVLGAPEQTMADEQRYLGLGRTEKLIGKEAGCSNWTSHGEMASGAVPPHHRRSRWFGATLRRRHRGEAKGPSACLCFRDPRVASSRS